MVDINVELKDAGPQINVEVIGSGPSGAPGKSPVIRDGNWWSYDDKTGDYVDTGVKAAGEDAPQIDDTQASPDHPWSGYKTDQEIKAVYDALEKSNIKFPVLYSGTSIHADNTLAENLTLNRNSVEILGQTIQNCLDHSSVDKFTLLHGSISGDGYIQIQADGTYRNFAIRSTSAVLKPSTQYTLVIDVAENTLVGDGNAFQLFATGGHISYFENGVNVAPVIGTTKFLATTKTDFEGIKNSFAGLIYSRITSGSIKFRLALIEGDWTNKDISWVPFGLNTPQTTEIIMENGDASERNAVTIRGPLGSVSDTIRDRVYLKDGKAYYEQNVASAVFDGSEDENWSAYTQQGMPNTYICAGTLGQIGKVAIPFSCISDRYARKYNFTMQNNGVANGAKDIVIRDDNYTTVENFVNYLQGSPITVIYQLATPITSEIQLSDFYSYEEQTNWYTTNAVKPTLKAEIPSNIGDVVSSTIAENAALRQENAALSQQLTTQGESLNQQAANLDYMAMMMGVDL